LEAPPGINDAYYRMMRQNVGIVTDAFMAHNENPKKMLQVRTVVVEGSGLLRQRAVRDLVESSPGGAFINQIHSKWTC
jgi:hypothetical protein